METRFLGAETIANGTTLFRFEKPDGFSFTAGQNADFTLIEPAETDSGGNTRTFSLVSTPTDDVLAVATRMRDTAFKRVLKTLAPGTPLVVDGPFGDFMLHENAKRPAVLIAGGIGITPFHSIARDAAARALPHRITLFYSNRRPEDAAFLSELQELQSRNPNFTLVPTITGTDSAEWSGARGHIDAPLLAHHVSPDSLPIYYLAGPPKMVAAMRKMLNESGVSNDDIRAEEFPGY